MSEEAAVGRVGSQRPTIQPRVQRDQHRLEKLHQPLVQLSCNLSRRLLISIMHSETS